MVERKIGCSYHIESLWGIPKDAFYPDNYPINISLSETFTQCKNFEKVFSKVKWLDVEINTFTIDKTMRRPKGFIYPPRLRRLVLDTEKNRHDYWWYLEKDFDDFPNVPILQIVAHDFDRILLPLSKKRFWDKIKRIEIVQVEKQDIHFSNWPVDLEELSIRNENYGRLWVSGKKPKILYFPETITLLEIGAHCSFDIDYERLPIYLRELKIHGLSKINLRNLPPLVRKISLCRAAYIDKGKIIDCKTHADIEALKCSGVDVCFF